ncbi:MAG: hypothetical protein ACRELV_08885, partial [Longimicrobiales bacterium]
MTRNGICCTNQRIGIRQSERLPGNVCGVTPDMTVFTRDDYYQALILLYPPREAREMAASVSETRGSLSFDLLILMSLTSTRLDSKVKAYRSR